MASLFDHYRVDCGFVTWKKKKKKTAGCWGDAFQNSSLKNGGYFNSDVDVIFRAKGSNVLSSIDCKVLFYKYVSAPP